MIPEILNILKLPGVGDIMLTKGKHRKYKKLSQELLALLCISAAISSIFYSLITLMVRSIATTHYANQGFSSYEVTMHVINISPWIGSIGLGASVFLFVSLFLFFTGQKLLYLESIIQGVEMLRTNHMAHNVPIEGNNELTKLAESINYLARVERELKEKETSLKEEREALIRALSHDIRTPLTSIMSYTEYLSKNSLHYPEEIREYLSLMNKKGMQIKILTNQLLDRSERELIFIEDGRFFIEQLAYDFEEMLGDDFPCHIDIESCPSFQGEYCIQDFQRVSDNLISNIHKYAREGSTVFLQIYEENNYLVLKQSNEKKEGPISVESHHIGLESIRRIVDNFKGSVQILDSDSQFEITINFFPLTL